MVEIKDCINKKIKISKNSITIKDDNNKTCGVIKNITSLYNMQPNKQIEYYKTLKQIGLHGKISIKDIIVKDNTMYAFRDIQSKLFHQKYGYFSESEKQKEQEQDQYFETASLNDIQVIECIFV